MELFWVLPFSLECFFNITQDIMGISGFMIVLCPSVIEAVLMPRQANNCLSNERHSWAFAISFASNIINEWRSEGSKGVERATQPFVIQPASVRVPTQIYRSFG